MRVAWLFDPTGFSSYDRVLQEQAFRALLRLPVSRLHLVIRTGDLLSSGMPHDEESRMGVIGRLLGRDFPIWTTLDGEGLTRATMAHRVYVIDVDGLVCRDAAATHELMAETNPHYLGALEVTPRIDLHWAVFDQLFLRYRLLGRTLRVLHDAFEVAAEDTRDWSRLQRWRDSGLFEKVDWENTGVSGTIFDAFDTLDFARSQAELRELVGGLLGVVTNEVTLRLAGLDPYLAQPLLAGLRRLEMARDEEEIAHVGVSFRRYLERLADALYPSTDQKREGRSLGKQEYKNRLAAYVEDTLPEANVREVVLSLDDIGRRLDSLVKAANEGIHATLDLAEAHRVGIGLVSLSYDILTLAPPVEADLTPHADHLRSTITDLLGADGHEDM